MITVKDLQKLTKQQLIHLLADVTDIDNLNRDWQECREAQATTELKCWDCESIANKLRELRLKELK